MKTRSIAFWALVLAGGFGGVMAQTPPSVVQAWLGMFEAVPVGGDYPRVFPRKAIERMQPGYAVLCCKAKPDRSLACTVGAEWPANFRFGAASLQLAERFKLTPEAYEKLRAEGFPTVETPMPWNLEPLSESKQSELNAAKTRMQHSCDASPSAPVS